ncbi:VOC family protein [Croceitalea marina]|uniref:VOC family protein n=1 Tax=Croceitalea marina TaxID=1775166 RepID=A0ABW5N0N6_9FLAO
MNDRYDTYQPEGFTTVNTYLFTEKPEALIFFLEKAFYAQEINRSINPQNGDIGNCILKIGDTCIMISQARGQFMGMRTALYLYVSDVDGIHKNALKHGAEELFIPADMDYGDRQSGVVDPAGNYWWISKRLHEKGYHE